MLPEQKIIFFDIDGTLLSTGGAGHRAIADALREEFGIDFPLDGVLTAGRTDRGITDEIFGRYGVENSDSSRERFRTSYLTRLTECLLADAGHLLPEVKPLLQHLAEVKHVTLSLITGNYEEGAWIKLRHFGLDSYFTFGGFGDHEADRDDVARNAIAAASANMGYDVAGHQTIVIGDTGADICCARAIGAKAVAVATGTYSRDELEPHAPDLLFEDFSDVASVARILLSLT